MAIITLTTDWKSNDFYLGAVKGVILSHMPGVTIVDLNHQVALFNSAQAAFVLRHAFPYYPKGTVHIVDVNSEAGKNTVYVAAAYRDHFFVGTDNGGFSLLFEERPAKMVRLRPDQDSACMTFPALHVFAPAASHLAAGKQLDDLGEPLQELRMQVQLLPTIDPSVISGTVIYIDSFHNAITNVSAELFEQVGQGRPFEILVQSNHYRIRKINRYYDETSSGELLAVFNSAGLLEIAINKGNIAELLNLGINSIIRIKFSGN